MTCLYSNLAGRTLEGSAHAGQEMFDQEIEEYVLCRMPWPASTANIEE